MSTAAPAFSAWLDDFLASYYRQRPVNATFIGKHEYDSLLPDLSPGGLAALVAEMASLQERLAALPAEPLSQAEAIDRRLAEGFLRIQQWECASGHFYGRNPSTYIGEAIFGVLSLLLRPFAPLEQRAQAAIVRMEAFPALLQSGRENVREAPLAWTERAIDECTGALAFLRDGGIERLIAEQGLDGVALRHAAAEATTAVQEYQQYLDTELRLHPSDLYACGSEAYELLLREGHYLDRDAASIEHYAQKEAESAAAYLTEHAPDFGVHSWSEVLAVLADEHPSIEQYYGRYSEIWEQARRVALDKQLVTWPDYPIEYVPQPVWAQQAAPHLYFLFYRAPAAFDTVLPVQYLVTPIEPSFDPAEQERRLRATNDSVITLNHVVHHGGLGHHVQNYYAYRAASRIGQIAAVDCAARIAFFCGGSMAEGWACYATDLMAESGYLSPRMQYAERHSRLRMAARAIVDIRMHRGEYTLEQAAAFYSEQVGMPPASAQAEAVKNSMFPGTAVMYLLGTDQIHELRRDLATAQGAAFDLCRFHDRLLSFGSIPVALIGAAMRAEVVDAAQ